MDRPPLRLKGRGAVENPSNRFEARRIDREPEDDWEEPPDRVPTQLIDDQSRSILATNESPDVGFEVSLNPYRGCEHGCIYCYARPTHEYLGFSAGLDFETKLMVKRDAPAMLRKALEDPRWVPRPIAMSGVTDAYQPVERELRITRGCLEVMAEFRQPVVIVTKNRLVSRDAHLLGELAGFGASAVMISVTTMDPKLARKMEPRASLPSQRLEAIAELASAGVPVGVLMSPMVPGLTEHEAPEILSRAAEAGARHAGYIPLRLPLGVADLFLDWLERVEPSRKEKIEQRIRDFRGGRLNESRFGRRMGGEGPRADWFNRFFWAACRRAGLARGGPSLSVEAFRRSGPVQGTLFD